MLDLLLERDVQLRNGFSLVSQDLVEVLDPDVDLLFCFHQIVMILVLALCDFAFQPLVLLDGVILEAFIIVEHLLVSL